MALTALLSAGQRRLLLFDHCDTDLMADEPYDGRIVIEWRRVASAPPDDFDWRITPEPPGRLTDEETSRLLAEIAERL